MGAVGFASDLDAPEPKDPGVGALNHPPVPGVGVPGTQWFAAASGSRWWWCVGVVCGGGVEPAAADDRRDCALTKAMAQGFAAVPAVCQHGLGVVAAVTQTVDQWQQVPAFVLVAGPDPDCDRQALGINT